MFQASSGLEASHILLLLDCQVVHNSTVNMLSRAIKQEPLDHEEQPIIQQVPLPLLFPLFMEEYLMQAQIQPPPIWNAQRHIPPAWTMLAPIPILAREDIVPPPITPHNFIPRLIKEDVNQHQHVGKVQHKIPVKKILERTPARGVMGRNHLAHDTKKELKMYQLPISIKRPTPEPIKIGKSPALPSQDDIEPGQTRYFKDRHGYIYRTNQVVTGNDAVLVRCINCTSLAFYLHGEVTTPTAHCHLPHERIDCLDPMFNTIQKSFMESMPVLYAESYIPSEPEFEDINSLPVRKRMALMAQMPVLQAYESID